MKDLVVGFFCGAMFIGAFAVISTRAEAQIKPKPVILDRPGKARILYTDNGCGFIELARRDFTVGGDR